MSGRDTRSSRPAWYDATIAERMAVDRSFESRIRESSLSNQSWELVMAAVELQVSVSDGDPDAAELTADRSSLESVLPAIVDMERQSGDRGRSAAGTGPLAGVLGTLRRVVGRDTVTASYRQEAERLLEEYTEELQHELEQRGRWEEVVAMTTTEPREP